jgi:D-alanine-D-alanine ligase-like ATP-grasp enzyme
MVEIIGSEFSLKKPKKFPNPEQNSKTPWKKLVRGRRIIKNADQEKIGTFVEAVIELVNTKYDGCWEKTSWVAQFWPVFAKFYPQFKYAISINPGLDGFSGFTGVSKQEIVQRLNPEFRPDHVFFEEVPTMEELEERFRKENDNQPLTFPIICKPDVGERATGVTYMYSREQLEEYLQPIDETLPEKKQLKLKKERASRNFHLEKFHDDREFALSWTKDPETGEYRVWSVIEKQIPSIIGDGKTTFRELIAHKVDAIELETDKKEKILKCYSREELNEIIPEGEEKTMVKTASISYGTKFKKQELTELQIQRLRELLPQLIQNDEGLYQGRFDFRAKDLESLVSGDLKIIELNGLGGMPMEIYESHLTIEEKYEILFRYFKYLLQLAKRNVEIGNAKKSVGSDGLVFHVGKTVVGKNKTQDLFADERVERDIKFLSDFMQAT